MGSGDFVEEGGGGEEATQEGTVTMAIVETQEKMVRDIRVK